eukprot:CAMPEP_0185770968 /NCGR_PEP_ID=MMETSP1174-20130828/62352_1 /TAXON_ID=35687 /ORGANISM="Dictyocha speculum, Strain CCMP1381" /LENGTH=273 /DNA_ID=CAMNT_0028456635 /DNA_START=39 /DNA_END=860 /DNA_ORIENTATION=-
MGVDGADALQKLSPFENTCLGVSAGIIDVSSTQWMLYCKNSTQQRVKIKFDPKIMYRGYSMSLTNMCILSGLQFPLTGLVTTAITGGKQRRLSDVEQISAGFVGGVISGFICAPLELVMIQQQRFGTSLIATPAKIIGQSGVTGIFRGLAMSCGREGVFTAGMLGLGPTLKRMASESGYSTYTSSIMGAIGGGVVVASISHPMDTIKTCQQGDVTGKVYGGVIPTARTLLAQAGYKRFFSGWAWRTSRMVLQTFLFDFTKTNLSPILFPHAFK